MINQMKGYYKKNNFKKHEPKLSPLEVKVDGSHREDFEEAFKRFKSLFQKEKIMGQLKERSSYEKPSEKKRRKRREAAGRRMMEEARKKMIASGEWAKRQKRKEAKKNKRIKERTEENNNNE